MKAIKYRIGISIDLVHRWGDQTIDEIFIPEVNVCFNEKGGCFFSAVRRISNGEEIERIEVEDIDAESLEKMCILKEKKDKIVSKYFELTKKE